MDNKYYTPEIEEFHVGLEFEILDYIENGQREWTATVYGNLLINKTGDSFSADLSHAYTWIKNEDVRVKYLDREDIESLGWVHKETTEYRSSQSPVVITFVYQEKDERGKEISFLYIPRSKWALIFVTHNHFDGSTSQENKFAGKIKNKSELKRLMKQLNIL